MSDTDSFIDEVTEEVRRDQLFQYLRKYGWIAVALVVLIVGTSAYIEWQRVKTTQQAQAIGDSIIAALDSDEASERLAALSTVNSDSAEVSALVALIAAGEAKLADDPAAALAQLNAVANDPSAPLEYQHLALFKSLTLGSGTLSDDERIAGFESLATPGMPYRILAQEQLALIAVEQGRIEDAVQMLEDIRIDAETSSGLRTRAVQLIVALGKEPQELGDFSISSGN